MLLRNRCARFALACWLLMVAGTGFAAAGADGPYLHQWTGEHWVADWAVPQGGESDARREQVAIGQSVTIDRVNEVPAFKVPVRALVGPAPDCIRVAADAPLMVVADTHGEYEILVALLRRHGIIGEDLHWTFGPGHLALLGDYFDRGAHQIEILWLIYKLEAEAAAAGGAVHMLLGNHEAMVLRGDERYLNPKYLDTAKALGVDGYGKLFSPETLLGQWLRSKPSIMKLNELLLVHGGVSPDLLAGRHSLGNINQAVRSALGGTEADENILSSLMLGRSGPLWYRGYFPMRDELAEATMVDVDAALAHFDAERIFVGHTAVPTITPLYGGKVLAAQVYPRLDDGNGGMIAEAALLQDGIWYRADVSGKREPIAL